jgi:hypothetical protein
MLQYCLYFLCLWDIPACLICNVILLCAMYICWGFQTHVLLLGINSLFVAVFFIILLSVAYWQWLLCSAVFSAYIYTGGHLMYFAVVAPSSFLVALLLRVVGYSLLGTMLCYLAGLQLACPRTAVCYPFAVCFAAHCFGYVCNIIFALTLLLRVCFCPLPGISLL